MTLRIAFFLVPTLLIPVSFRAQTPVTQVAGDQTPAVATPAADPQKPAEAPAEVDQALRARAKEFLQHQVDGNYRKAYDMVAEDSRDFYFGMAKPKYTSFELASIDFTDNFTKAVVNGTVKRTGNFGGHDVELPIPFKDTWSIENGKWMWTHQETKMLITPLGDIPIDPNAKPATDPATAIPKDTSAAAAAAAAEKQLAVKATVSKESLLFTAGKAGSDEVVFHNGLTGFIHLLATPLFDGGVFKAEPSETDVGPGKDVTIVVRYSPSAGTPLAPTLRLTVEPFEQAYFVALKLSEADK